MLASSRGPRTSSQSLATWPARKTAAWPAELPPPTSASSWPAQSLPSIERGPVVDGRALELCEIRDVDAAVADAAGDHHGARADPFLVREPELEARRLAGREASQAHDLVRDRHLGAELLRLVEGARHQRHAGDSGRKAHVVLDPRRRARLTAEGAAVEHDDREPLRRRVDGRCEAGRSGADDRDVVDAVRIDRAHQTDAARQLGLAGIAQQISVRAEHDRQLRRLDAEALDQRPRAGVAVGIERLVRLTVARQESRQPEHAGVAGGADDQRARETALQQTDAAQDERAHDALAELGLHDENVAQALRRDHDRLDRLHRMRVHQRRPAGELVQLAHERPGTVRDDRLLVAEHAALRDRNLAIQDDEHAGADLARRDHRSPAA